MLMTFDKILYYYIHFLLLSTSRFSVFAALPVSVQTSIPICAHTCLEDFIQQEFSSICSDTGSLECLCAHRGSGGYALGEGAYACIYSSTCSFVTKSNSSAIYTICAGQSGTVIPTHQPISITPLPTPRPAIASSNSAATSGRPALSTAMTQASVSAGADGVNMTGKISLTMAQIAGITIAAAALLILTVGIFSCVFFVRKRNKRLEMEDQKALTYNTPKSPDMHEVYFPPPPTMDNRRRRGSAFSILPRRREQEQENGITWGEGTTIQREWPRYYPVMPQENIGVAETTNYALQVSPIVRASVASYTPTIPAPYTPATPVSYSQQITAPYTPPTSKPATPPAAYQIPQPIFYQPPQPVIHPAERHSSGVILPPPPPVARSSLSKRPSHGSRRRSRAPSRARKSRALSAMTDIEESEQMSSRELSLVLQSQQISEPSADSSGGEHSSGEGSAKSSARKRKPTLTIDIPLKMSSRLPPPPPSRPTSTLPPPPRSRPGSTVIPLPARPPLVRSNQMAETSTASQLLAVASSYANRSSTASSSAYSPALPSSQVLAGSGPTFLLSDSESRSTSSGTKHLQVSRRDSDASCTSFEDYESGDDTTPPKESDKRLSPVKEASPVSYPKVPRGSNQTVPRRSPAPSPVKAGKSKPSLMVNQSIGNKLWKTELSPQAKKPLPTPEWAAQRRTESWDSWAPREREENVATGTTVWATPDMLGSPFMPKITPTMRGDDMVLEFR